MNIALPSIDDWIPVAGVQAAYGPLLFRVLPEDGSIADAVLTIQIKVKF